MGEQVSESAYTAQSRLSQESKLVCEQRHGGSAPFGDVRQPCNVCGSPQTVYLITATGRDFRIDCTRGRSVEPLRLPKLATF